MAVINMQSILDKAKSYVESDGFQRQIETKVDDALLHGGGKFANGSALSSGGASMAAGKFIEVLQDEIRSHAASSGFADGNLGSTAVSALENIEHGEPVKVGKNRYLVDVWFSGDLYRDSLDPWTYGGIDNIAALLNNGYDANDSIYGEWDGHSGALRIRTLAHRSGAHFVQSAIRNFMANYASEYGVLDIKVDPIYE